MYNFKIAQSAAKDAEREKAAYEKLLAKYNALQFAADEGVFQVTLHTDSGAVTVPVSFLDGRSIATDLADGFAKWVQHMEATLNYSVEAAGDDFKASEKEAQAKEEAREAQFVVNRQVIAQHSLAQQAAATAAPAQKGPGRPKRVATPKPQVAQQLAVAANAAPMNNSSQLPGGGVASQPQA